jgi:hypothetical protein
MFKPFIKGLLTLAIIGSSAVTTMLASTTAANAFNLSDLDPFNKNSAIRQIGRDIDLTNPNSSISNTGAGRFINRVGRAIDPTNPQRNGGYWQKLDITDPNQPISQFCQPIAKYGVGGATAYFSGSPEAAMLAGGAASSALCGGGSNYGASRNLGRGYSDQDPMAGYGANQAASFDEWKKQQDYLNESGRKEWDRQQQAIEANDERRRQHELRLANMNRGNGLEGFASMMQSQRRQLIMPSF